MIKQEYPKMIYHISLGSKIVKSFEEHKEMGSEWKETPADLVEKKAPKTKAVEKKVKEKEKPISEMSVSQLLKAAEKRGVKKKEAKSLDKEELLELIKE